MAGQPSSRIHVGLGDQTEALSVVVLWPDGTAPTMLNAAAGVVHQISAPAATAVGPAPLPRWSQLDPPYPNPANPRSVVRFGLEQPGPVDLIFYDVAGRRVRTLVAGENLGAGSHTRVWNGTDDRGHPVGSGVYLVRMQAVGNVWTQKLTLVR